MSNVERLQCFRRVVSQGEGVGLVRRARSARISPKADVLFPDAHTFSSPHPGGKKEQSGREKDMTHQIFSYLPHRNMATIHGT